VTRGVTFAPVPIPVGHAEENPVELQPSWARLGDEQVRYVFEAYDWDTIEGWSRPGQHVEWRLLVARAGRYELEVDYGCAPAAAGGRLRLTAGGSGVELTTWPTATANVFRRAAAGVLMLPAGPLTLRAEVAAAPPAGELMRLNRVRLRLLD